MSTLLLMRLTEELHELDTKISNLETFRSGSVFTTLPDDYRFLTEVQLKHMQSYRRALSLRVAVVAEEIVSDRS
jgi:hypothetical protein